MREIIIDIDEDGGVRYEVNGVEGKECEALTRPFQEATGEIVAQHKKPEYHRTATHTSTRTRTR